MLSRHAGYVIVSIATREFLQQKSDGQRTDPASVGWTAARTDADTWSTVGAAQRVLEASRLLGKARVMRKDTA